MKRPHAGSPSRGASGLLGGQPPAEPEDALSPAEAAAASPGAPSSPAPAAEEEASEGLRECPLCLLAQPAAAFPALSSCAHLSCLTCLQQYLRIEISESRVQVACPHCPAPLQPAEVHQLLRPEPALRDKYEEYLLRRLLVADPGTRWCPAPDCSYAVIAYGCAECPRLVCARPDCRTEFCFHCRQPWHPDASCEQAWREWSQQAPLGAMELSLQLIRKEEAGAAAAAAAGAAQDKDAIKVCPRCRALIMKVNDGSCNRMNCTVCGCLFCWLCLREITDVHFLSPSGCTFWGKKPWSRTRKLLWQLGMVLGAPMVISLVAGIAVPVMTLGIPIYMGKKVLSHGRKSKLSSCQQCLSVASSILLSLFVSPVITAVTVGVGVPLMLTYVYGVVILSLCRNRWGCGGARRKATELSAVELENLAKLNELLAVLPTPMVAEGGSSSAAAAMAAPFLPSRSSGQMENPCRKGAESQWISPAAPAGSAQSAEAAQAASRRDGLNRLEVAVEVETEPPAAHEHSLCSAPSGHSFSTDSLTCTSDGCSLAGVTTE